MDLAAGDNSDVSYFEITGCNGNQYEYRGAKAEDVLFTPDVFPLEKSKDQDGDPDNHSVTVTVSELTFGDDEMSQALNLDESTTVDPGDYLALYTDLNSGTAEYGEITKVEQSGSNYILAYQTISLEEMQAAMDVYQKDQVEGDDLLEETDRENLEEQIQVQAMESGSVLRRSLPIPLKNWKPLWRKNLVQMFLWNIQTKIRVTKQKKVR